MLTNALFVMALVSAALAAVLALVALRKAFTEVPAEDRQFLDTPPGAFRLAWPLIQLASFRLAPFLSVSYRQKTQLLLRYAGLDYALSPEQFFGSKVIAGGLCAVTLHVLLLPRGGVSLLWLAIIFLCGFVYPDLWLRDQREARQRKILKALPLYLDIITLCVEAGLNLTSALTQAVQKGPANPFKQELTRVLRDVRTGRPRAEAFRSLAERVQMPAISSVVSALITAERQGSALGPILRAQSEQRRNERFQRAEKLAMEAPVKMLFPLIAFIFPCTFAVIGFPIAMKFMQAGLIH
jgi:tight adherence protein C